ncbi:MAG: hypothetical protein P8Z79_09595 [Sedimentisphaerales bacterium]
MKKLLVGLLILGALLAVCFYLRKEAKPEAAPGAIVFEMQYRGLSGAKDELRYNAYWGFGQREQETSFIKEAKEKGGVFSTVYNSNFKGAEWSAVEVKDNKAEAFYFDLNADGKVSENEKILPIEDVESGSTNRTEFVTPDFTMTTKDGHKVPFRVLLQVAFHGQPSRPNCMWSPSCVLEGTSILNDKPTKLILFGNGFTGDFDTFGRCSYSLLNDEDSSGRYISRHNLSRIIHYEDRFYNLTLSGNYEKDKKIHVDLEPYVGTTGGLVIQLNGESNLKTKLSYARIVGSNDNTICFEINSDQTKLPTGAYRLERGYLNYGAEKEDQWRVDFTKGPEFRIDADKTGHAELGKLTLSVRAVEETKRYNSDVKEQTVYTKGTDIYISPVVKGKAGELYGRLSEKQNDSGSYKDVQPDLRIVDKAGKDIVSEKLAYG